MVREFQVLGVDLTVLDQSIDTTTPSGRLLFHVLAAIAEFERDLIRDRVMAGLRRARRRA
jgi:DNA invertase Pin-like site-specific DNA recombinase